MCNSYLNPPDFCTRIGVISTSKLNDKNSTGLPTFVIVLIIIFVVLFNIALIFICIVFVRRKMKARLEASNLEDKITSAVTSYMALREK